MTEPPLPGNAHAYRWPMFLGMVMVYTAFGVMVASIPPMVAVVREDLGMSRGAMGLALSSWTMMYIFTAPLAGRVIDRIGVGRSLIIGAVSLIASALARSVAEGTVSLLLAVAIMGIGGPLVSASAPTLCAQWFRDPNEQQRAVGLYNLGPAIGGTVTVFATNSILLPWLGNWRNVLRFEAGFATVALMVWLLVWLRAPSLPKQVREHLPLLRSWSRLIRSPSVRHVLLLGALSFLVMHSMGAWGVDALSTQASISATASGWWVAGGGFVGMGLLAVVAEIAAKIGRPTALLVTWACVIVGLGMLALAPPLGAELGMLVSSARNMLVPLMIMTLMASPDVDDNNMGVATGLWFSVAQIGATIGPFATGRVADTDGGFTLAMLLLAGVGVVVVMIVAQNTRRTAAASTLA